MTFKKFHSKITLILSWTVFFSLCILTLSAQENFTFTDTGKYTIDRWRAVMLIQDAYQKLLLEVLVDSLESRIAVMESWNTRAIKSYNSELSAEKERVKIQGDQINYQTSMKEYYKNEARKYKRQRNAVLVFAGTASAYGIFRVFVPP